MTHKTLSKLLVELCADNKGADARLVFQQSQKLQEQYRRDNGFYTTRCGLLKQETFAYLIIKKNLERGLYRK